MLYDFCLHKIVNIIALSDPYTLLDINLFWGDEDGNFLIQVRTVFLSPLLHFLFLQNLC
jgi:hypothetical protein